MIQLRDLMAQGNILRNQDTGATYDLGPSQQAGPAVDYSMAPVEIPGYGKGYRLKGDSLSAVLTDGRIVRFGEDTGAARKMDLAQVQMQGERLKNQRMQQEITQGKQATVPAGYRMLPTGDMEPIPGGPADLKAQAQAALKAGGATDVDLAIGTLRDAYDRLNKGGGITSTEKGPVDNFTAAVSASAPGQAIGKMFGTNNQSARNDIAMTRPALLAALMKATGMSAKQMDSNAELKLWLATATDPTLDVESNQRALANIERKYLGAKAPNFAPDANTKTMTMQDVLDTAKKAGKDPIEVIKAAKAKGYRVEGM